MVSSVFKQAAEMLRRRKRNKWWLAAFLCLAAAAVVGTLAVLKPTGRAMTREEKVLACRHAVHQHTEGCYAEGENGRELVCGYADFVIHRHMESCYDGGGALACVLPEVETHVHEAGCFEEERTLVCGLLDGDGGHEHTEACYGEAEQVLICGQEENGEHVHSQECYQAGEAPLICGMEAGAGGHGHTEACVQVDQRLICQRPEARPHIHDGSCYQKDENGNDVRICGLLQTEEHIHGEDCFETVEVTIEETGAPGEDASEAESAEGTEAVAETETADVAEGAEETAEEETKGTEEASETETAEETEDAEYVCGLEEHAHEEACYDGDGVPACGLEEHAHEEDCLAEEEQEYVCGLAEHVHEETCYDGDGGLICGLEEHTHGESCLEAEETAGVITQTWENERYVITAAYTEAAKLPENAVLQAEEITEESDPERYAKRDAEAQELVDETLSMKCLFNIGFFVEGEEVEPQDKVSVTIQFLDENGYAEGDPVTVVHFAKEETQILEGTQIDGSGATSFDTESFSDMAIFVADDGLVRTPEDLKRRLEHASDGEVITLGEDFSVVEGTDAGSGITVNAGVSVVLDLNGHTISVEGSQSLINVMNGSSLTIRDSVWDPAADVRDGGSSWNESGWHGSGSYGNGVLTYYEIASAGSGTGTAETLYTHEAAVGGKILWNGTVSEGNALIFVKDGTLTLESGMLNGGGRVRAVTAAQASASLNTLNLAGGYICSCASEMFENWAGKVYQANGGAVYAGSGTTVNLTGTVIANNEARYDGTTENWGSGGGLAVFGNSTLNISGGMVTGNCSSVYGKGGGIYTSDSVTVNLSGGNICNNMDLMVDADALPGPAGWNQPRHTEYKRFDGGGGIQIGVGCTLNMTGGMICANTASGGGGIQTGRTDGAQTGPKLYISGGFIARNLAVYHEGGGIVITGQNGTAEIAAGQGKQIYITNNETKNRHDWGGGGVFCVENARLVIQGALISGNSAKGYGGGVGGCSNAQIISSVSPLTLDLGTAVFDNAAGGDQAATATAEGKWDKDGLTDDSAFAVFDAVFQKMITKADGTEAKAYDDYYCEQYSTVSNLMLGGGYSNWAGSSNDREDQPGQAQGSNNSVEIQFRREQNDIRSARNRMGLTADPTRESKEKAVNGASVFITGNHSATHGGGVQCNGVLLLGDCKNYIFGDSLQLEAEKQLFGSDGNRVEDLTGNGFKFGMYPYDKTAGTAGEQPILTAENNGEGQILFDPLALLGDGEQASLSKEYLIREIPSGNGGIQWDPTEYLVTVNLEKEVLTAAGGASYQWTRYSIIPDAVTVQSRQSSAEAWGEARPLEAVDGSGANGTKIYKLPDDLGTESGAAFTNREIEQVNVRVEKIWKGPQAGEAEKESGVSVWVQLFQSRDNADEEPLGDVVELTKDNGWSHTWSGLTAKEADGTGVHTYSYTVKETGITFPDGSAYQEEQFVSVSDSRTEDTDTQVTVITNTHVDDLKYDLTLTKVMGDKDGEAVLPYSFLAGAKFELYRVEGESKTLLELIPGTDGYEYAADLPAEGDGMPANVQEAAEKQTVTELITGTDGRILVRNLPKGSYQFREVQAPAGFVAKPDGEMPVVTLGASTAEGYVKDVAYSEEPIVDGLYYYAIPESGGMGTARYTGAGVVLCLLAAGMICLFMGERAERKKCRNTGD